MTSRGNAPYLMMAFGMALMCFMDAGFKMLAAGYPPAQIAAARFAGGVVAALLLLVFVGRAAARFTGWKMARFHVIRGVLNAAVVILFIHGLSAMPLSQAIPITFTSPIFIVLFSTLMLKEGAPRAFWYGLVLAFAGVLIITRPWSASVETAYLIAAGEILLATVSYAGLVVLMRHQAKSETPWAMAFYPAVITSLVLIPVAAVDWQPPAPVDWPVFLALGFFGTGGNMAMAWALARATAARLAPIDYTALIWATVLGVLLFDEAISFVTLGGAALVALGCALSEWRFRHPATRVIDVKEAA